MDNGCNEAVNESASVTPPAEPIKISIYTSDDGQYHMKYDECAAADDNGEAKSKRKSAKSSTTTKSATETLYEIDLYCSVCNHDYKSLMSLNRHMKTRKHLNQLAKLNEANEQAAIGRGWSDFDNHFSAFNLMPHSVCGSVVHTVFNDAVDTASAKANNAIQHNETDPGDFQNTYDSYEGVDNHCAVTSNDSFHDIHEAMDATASDDTYDENRAMVDIIQRSMADSYKCSVCGEQFISVDLLQEHTQRMRETCAAKIDSDMGFDLEAELLAFPLNC